MRVIYLFILIIISIKLLAVKDYNIQFSQISTKDGLSQNTVRTILSDKKGFIWAGTLDGLNRYDGYSLVSYKPQLGNPNSLIDHRIREIFQDKDGFIWIRTFMNEFNCYDPITNSFLNYYDFNKDKERTSFLNYTEASNGDVWLWGGPTLVLDYTRSKKKLRQPLFSQKKFS